MNDQQKPSDPGLHWTPATIEAHFRRLLEEMSKRIDDHFICVEKALDTAIQSNRSEVSRARSDMEQRLSATKDLTDQHFEANSKRIDINWERVTRILEEVATIKSSKQQTETNTQKMVQITAIIISCMVSLAAILVTVIMHFWSGK